MPIPNTKGALPVTQSNFEQPYQTPTVRPGMGGLVLRKTIDGLDPVEASRLTNMHWDRDGQLTSRPGLVVEATTGGTRMHSMERLNNPLGSSAKRIWGVDSSVYIGLEGALSSVDSGYSGNPLSIVPYRPPLSGQSWAYIADSSRMRKVRFDGLDLQIGLPAPSTATTAALATAKKTDICDFESGDSSAAAAWTGHGGTSLTVPPTPNDGNSARDPGAHVEFVTTQATTSDYYQFWALQRSLNLGRVGLDAGAPAVDSTDDDHIHLWFKISDPNMLREARIYFVVSNDFDPASEMLPGTEVGANTDSYVKSFRPGDLAAFFSGSTTASTETTSASRRGAEEDFLDERDLSREALDALGRVEISGNPIDGNFKTNIPEFRDADGNIVQYRPAPAGATAQTAQGKRIVSSPGGSGSHEWVEFGVAGNPLRKSEFRRIGSTTGRDWSTVTGIIVYIQAAGGFGVSVALDDMYLTGGCGPDNSDVGAAGYDYRHTDFDPRTGAESNPSPILPDSEPYGTFAVRRCVTLTPASSGDSALRQRFYRRGGALGDNWYYLGVNTSDGGAFTDDKSDASITNADALEIDHDQPVTTVDTNGNIVRAQPLAAMWGPVQDILFGCGDPYRPGHLYWSIPGEPDHWSPVNTFEVCDPSEELMNGGYYGGQAFVFSRERMYWIYPNLTDAGAITVTPTSCAKGLTTRWALTVGPQGIFFVNRGGVWRTSGGNPDLLSMKLGDEDTGGIFSSSTVNGYAPIDWDSEGDIQLEIWGNELWFMYRDTGGNNQILILDLSSDRWRHYDFGVNPGLIKTDETESGDESRMIIGGRSTGDAYEHRGTADNSSAIACQVRTGAWDGGRGREDKQLGDLFVDLDRDGTNITVQTLLNDETTTNSAQTISSGSGRDRYVLDAFGATPQRARSVSVDVSWSSASRRPKLEQVGVSYIPDPESTSLRATQWDDVNDANEKWLYGVMIECDTYGVDRPVIVEYMQGDTVATASTFTINNDGRRREFYTWTFVRADRVRVRPVTDCAPWILYELSWLCHEQPPRIEGMDSGEEGPWDTYYTGLDLDINTFNQVKTFNVYADGVALTNPVTGTTTFNVQANGRQVVHLSFGPGRAHIYRFVATDTNPGLLYNHRWQLQDEPSEQTNWNQNFTIAGTHTDKWIKGVKLECDTFAQDKTVTIEVDGSVAATLTVNTNDRSVVHEAFPQVRGRVVRILPTDNNPGRLYSASLIFDEEPLGLDRWETQELTLGARGWKALLEGWITLRSSATVTLTVTHVREDGTSTDRTYTLPNTSGVKTPHYLTFEADKAVLFKFLFTSSADFWLYRPESNLKMMVWETGEVVSVQPFGDDDLDLVRGLSTAEQIAGSSGGGS